MTIKDSDFIKVDYTESVDGRVISTTDEELALKNDIFDDQVEYGPRLVVVGSGDMVEGFKEELTGKEIGDSGHVEVSPEKAFGVYDPEDTDTVLITKFKEEKPEPGMRVSVDGKMGTVSRIIGRKVRIDFNHPLAGKTIVYDYTIREMIEDPEEKLRGLMKLFARMDLDLKIVDGVAEIDSPWEMCFYKEWPMIKRGVAEMAMRMLDLEEIRFIESHRQEIKVTSELISPPSKAEIPSGENETPEEAVPADEVQS